MLVKIKFIINVDAQTSGTLCGDNFNVSYGEAGPSLFLGHLKMTASGFWSASVRWFLSIHSVILTREVFDLSISSALKSDIAIRNKFVRVRYDFTNWRKLLFQYLIEKDVS